MKTYYVYKATKHSDPDLLEVEGKTYNLYISESLYNEDKEPQICWATNMRRRPKKFSISNYNWIPVTGEHNTIARTDILITEAEESEMMLMIL